VCTYTYIFICKETVVSSRRLLQYFQLPDKNSRDISKYTFNFCDVVKLHTHYRSAKLKKTPYVLGEAFCTVFVETKVYEALNISMEIILLISFDPNGPRRVRDSTRGLLMRQGV
jgi:hypothetical protein